MHLRAFESEGVLVEHDGATGITSIRFRADASFDEHNASAVVAHLATLLDVKGAPLRILGDGRNTQRVTLLWQLRWSEFLRRHRADVLMAIHGLPPPVRVIAESISYATGARVHFVPDEAAGRRWLLRPAPAAGLRH